MTERALTFGSVAAAHERYRPGYPDDVVEKVLAYAGTPWLQDDDHVPSPDGTPEDSALQWPSTELAASELFTDVTPVVLEQRTTMSAHDHVGLLSTRSSRAAARRPPPDRWER